MDTGTPTRDSFSEAKKYSSVRFIGSDSRDLMDWELNELQKILATDRKNITDQILKDGAIIFELGATIGLPQPGIATGDDSAECSGAYQGTETQTYTVTITTGGAPGVAKFNYETSGSDASSGETTIAAFDTPLAVGTLGVYIAFSDGGDGVLAAGDSWIIPCTFGELLPTVDGNTLSVPSLRVYCQGRMEPVDGADLEFAAAVSGYDYVWLERLKYKVTYDEDADLVNPDTGEPVAQREKIVCTLKIEDTSGDALPTGAEERYTYQLYRWDRATDEVSRVIERYSKLNLNHLDGMLDATKVLQVGLNEELQGLLARRTSDESGSYLVYGLNSFYDADLTTDRQESGELTINQRIIATAPGKAYVRGVEIESPGEIKTVEVCQEYDAVANEPQVWAHGQSQLMPDKANPNSGTLPIESITSLSGPVRVCEEITRGAVPGGSDSLSNTNLLEVLAVTAADGVGGAAPASLTAPQSGPYVIAPLLAPGGDWTFPADPYLLEIEIGEYGSVNTRTLTFHFCGSLAGGWTVDEICEAINYGRGPAFWGYSGDSGPYNLIAENSGGKLKLSTLTCGGWSSIKIKATSSLAYCFGWTGGEKSYGSGTNYNSDSDYVKSGNKIAWWPGGAEPATGTKYRVVYTYIKTFVENTDFVLGGLLGGGVGGATATYYYAVTAVTKAAKGEETEVSNIHQITSNGAVNIFWSGVAGAQLYNIYRGDSRDSLKLIGRTSDIGWTDVNDFDPVIDYPYAETVEGGQVLPSYKMVEVKYFWDTSRRNISFKISGGSIPVDGGTLSLDYNYYLLRYILRVMDAAGEIKDIVGTAEDSPQVPPVPGGTIPLCKILQRIWQAPVVTNYDLYRVTMQDLQSVIREVVELRDGLAEQEALNAALLGETADINGIFIEQFLNSDQIDESDDDHHCQIRDGLLTLPQEVVQADLEITEIGETGIATTAELKKRFAMIGYTAEAFIAQNQWSSFKRINPYTGWDDLPPTIALYPRIDYWVDEERHFEEGTTQTPVGSAQEHEWSEGGLAEERWRGYLSDATPRYFRSREVLIEAFGFSAGKEVSASFAGRPVNLTPSGDTVAGTTPGTVLASEVDTDDPGGKIEATFTIPEGIPFTADQKSPWRAKAVVVLTDVDGNSGQSYYIASARVDILEDHADTVEGRHDPLAQIISWEGDSPVFIDKILLPLPEPEVASIPVGTVLQLLVRNCQVGLPNREIVGRQLYIYRGREPSPGAQSPEAGFYAPGSNNHLHFDDPVFLPPTSAEGVSDGLYSHSGDLAVCLLTNNAHLRAFVAALGEQGQNPSQQITDQAYRGGVLLSSADAVTWTPHQDTDLRFTAYRCKFSASARLAFSTISEDDVTEIELIAPAFIPTSDCSLKWYFQLDRGVRRVWFSIEPNQPIRFSSEQSSFVLHCQMATTDDYVSPMVMYDGLQLILRKNLASGGYVSKTSFMNQDFDGVRVKIEQNNPAGTSQEIYVSNDDGETWHQLTSDYLEETATVDEDFDDYTYDFSGFAKLNRKFKIKILQSAASGNNASAPESKNLRVITYTT